MSSYRCIVTSLLLSGRGRRGSVSGTWAFLGVGTERSYRPLILRHLRLYQTSGSVDEGSAASAASAQEQATHGPVPISKLLIANRGEIACRVISTARKLGIPTVTVFSEADRSAIHARSADEAFCIGPAAARDSYLRMDRILEVSLSLFESIESILPGCREVIGKPGCCVTPA